MRKDRRVVKEKRKFKEGAVETDKINELEVDSLTKKQNEQRKRDDIRTT